MKRRGVSVEKATNREILRKQLEMLAEDSVKRNGEYLIKNSLAMNQLYKSLVHPFSLLFSFIFAYLCFSFSVKLHKLLWS